MARAIRMISFGIVGRSAFGSRDHRHAGLLHCRFRRYLVAHQPDRVAARTDEDETALLDLVGEVGISRKETVARDGSPRRR
jgi:hypothetical protein